MAAGRKEYELQMKLSAAIGSSFNSSFQAAMSTTKKLQTTLSSLKKVQGDISAYKKTQEALSATRAKVQEYETKHNALQNELAQTAAKEKELQRALKQSEKSAGKESEEYKELQNQLQNTRNEKYKLKSQIEENERSTAKANDKIEEQEKDLTALSNQLKTAGVNTNSLAQENNKLEKAYQSVKKAQENYARVNSAIEQNKAAISATKSELLKTVGVIGTAGAAFYKGFITPAANLQEQMSTVKALISASSNDIDADMTRLNAIAKEMGATTKFTAVEAGQALEYMGMAGWNAAQMEAGLPGVMNLAAAAGEDLATVSDIVTDAMTAFGMSAEESGRFADVLARTATSANTTVGIMGETFQQIAPLAGAMGYKIEDMSVAIGLMANAGIKGSKGGVALKNVIANLADPSKEVSAAMEKLNVSLVNNDGTTKTFKEVVNSLRNSFSGLTEAEKAAYAATIGGKEGMAGLLAIVNSSEEDFAKLTEQINDCSGAAEEMAAIKLDNLNGDITLAKSAWDGLATTIGDLFLPNLRTAVQKVTEFLNKANDFAQKNPKLIKQIGKVAAGLAALKVGSLAGKLGFLNLKGGVLEVVKSFAGFKANIAQSAASALTGGNSIKTLGTILSGLGGKILPIIGLISALSILFLKLSGEDISSFIEPFKTAFEELKPVLSTALERFKELGKQVLPPLVEAAKKLAPILGQIVTAVLPVVIQLIDSLVPLICQIVQDLLPVALNIITTLAPLISEMITSILPVVVQLLEILLPIIKQIITSVLPIVVKVLNTLLPLIAELIHAVLPVLISILQALMPIIQAVAELFSVFLASAIEGIKPVIEAFMGYLKGIIDFITGVFTGDWSKAWEGIKSVFENIVNGLVAIFKLPINCIIDLINVFIGGLNTLKIPDWVPGVGGKGINIPLIPKLEKGSNYTPDTFIAGDVNGKGGELVTGARGRKVFTAAQTNAIFDNINRAKAINDSAQQSSPQAITIIERIGGFIGAVKSAAAERITSEAASVGMSEIPASNEQISFVIHYNPTIYIEGNKPDDLEEKLKENNQKLLELFKEYLRQQRENERRMNYA